MRSAGVRAATRFRLGSSESSFETRSRWAASSVRIGLWALHRDRIPGLRRHQCVTDVLNEYRRLTDRRLGRMLARTTGSAWTAAGQSFDRVPEPNRRTPAIAARTLEIAPNRIITRFSAHSMTASLGSSRPGRVAKRKRSAHAFAITSHNDRRSFRLDATPSTPPEPLKPTVLQHKRVPQLP